MKDGIFPRKVRRVGAGEEEGLRAEEEDAADRVEEGVEAQDEAVQEEVQEVLPLALKGGPFSPCPVHTHRRPSSFQFLPNHPLGDQTDFKEEREKENAEISIRDS